MEKKPLKYVPPEEWKTAQVQPTAGLFRKRLSLLYVLMLPAAILVLLSFLMPNNLRIAIQLVDIVFIFLLSLIIFILSFVAYNAQRKEEKLGYTTWNKPKK